MASINDEIFRYALNDQNDIVSIANAPSGKKGYRCRGCLKPMIAVHYTDPGHDDFFRHDVLGIAEKDVQCVYSNETYRHKVAIMLLLKLKKIKIPGHFKYSNDRKLTKRLIPYPKSKRVISADRALREHYVYLDENFDIAISKGKPTSGYSQLIKPDLIFFKRDSPILFLEVKVTNKVDDEKLEKIKAIGIDAIEISIPIGTEEEIEKSFLRSGGKYWLFNNLIQNTSYESLPSTSQEPVLESDNRQRRILTKSFECKKSELRNGIQEIRRYLESERYFENRNKVSGELEKLEEVKTRLGKQWEELRGTISERVTNGLKREISELGEEETEFQRTSSDLESRYKLKRAELGREQQGLWKSRKAYLPEIDRLEEEIKRIESNIEENRRKAERIDQRIREERRDSKSLRGLEGEFLDEEGRRAEGQEDRLDETIAGEVEDRRRSQNERIEIEERGVEEQIRRIGEAKGRLEEDIGREVRDENEAFERLFVKERRRIEDEIRRIEEIRKRRTEPIQDPDDLPKDHYFQRAKRIVDFGRFLDEYSQEERTLSRARRLKELFETSSFKTWKGFND